MIKLTATGFCEACGARMSLLIRSCTRWQVGFGDLRAVRFKRLVAERDCIAGASRRRAPGACNPTRIVSAFGCAAITSAFAPVARAEWRCCLSGFWPSNSGPPTAGQPTRASIGSLRPRKSRTSEAYWKV